MADVLAGFLSGAQAGRAANLGRAKAKAQAAEKKANFDLKLATQANVVRGAREDQMSRLETMITSPEWEASNTPRALAFAKSIDDSYGGTDATKYLKTALNLGVRQDKDSFGNRKYATGEGGVTTAPEIRSSSAGFTGVQQKMKSQATSRKLGTEEIAGRIKEGALKYVMENGTTDGQVDPAKVGMAMLKYSAMLEAEPGMDQKTVQAVMDNFEADIGKALADQAGLMGEAEDRDKYINNVSKAATKNIRDIFASEFGISGEITKMIEGSDAIVSEMINVANRKAAIGWNVPQIMMQITAQYVGKDGKWPTGVNANRYQRALAQSTEEFKSEVATFYSVPANDPSVWVPVYDPIERDGWMVNNETGEMKMLVGASSAAPVAPPKKEELPPQKQANGVDRIKTAAKEKASGGVVTTPYDPPPPRDVFKGRDFSSGENGPSTAVGESTSSGKIKSVPYPQSAPRNLFGSK